MRKLNIQAISILIVVAFAMIAVACSQTDGQRTREESIDVRNEVFEAAQLRFPEPRSENFPAREALVEYAVRQDRLDTPYFVYVLGVNGNIINYFVSRTLPVNVCAFLSSTEDIRTSSNGNLITTAPSLDGIFYGGSGASADCKGVIIFDQVTDAMLIISGPGMIVSDQPLDLDLEPVKISAQ